MAERMACFCGSVGFELDDDGFYYCNTCRVRAEGIAETGVNEEDLVDTNTRGAIYSQHNTIRLKQPSQHSVKIEPETQQSQQQSYVWTTPTTTLRTPKKQEYDDSEPCGPSDFGDIDLAANDMDLEMISSEIRNRYVAGIQLMIQYQCDALVEKFGVSPLICGLVSVIWLRFVAESRVFDASWIDESIDTAEIRKNGEVDSDPPILKKVMIWFKSLRKVIPTSTSLAISFLACHVAREVILPSDVVKWALEGKLPYLTAFTDVEKCIWRPTSSFPLTASSMFRPTHVVGSKVLEAHAGSIAQRIGLQLPPVNFHAIAHRYLNQLSLPVEKILPHASRIYEWAMPPDLWLSANLHRHPTCVCVMSILLIAIRILYNINGFGKWEGRLCGSQSSTLSEKVEKSRSHYKSKECEENAKFPRFEPISKPGSTLKCKKRNKNVKVNDVAKSCASTDALRGFSSIQNSEFDAAQLLCKLETTHEKICHEHEYMKDLKTYLSYCKDVAFAGVRPDNEEEIIIEQLWKFYENQEDAEVEVGCTRWMGQKEIKDEGCVRGVTPDDAKPRNDECSSSIPRDNDGVAEQCLNADGCSPSLQEEQTLQPSGCASAGSFKDKALRRLKLNMEENGFLYIPPRVKLKRFDYLHYIRKNDEGSRRYVAHADYYILLRACARVVQVNSQYMHAAVLRLEKRLAWIENRIDQCLHWRAQNPSPDSYHDRGPPENMDGDSLDFSNYKFVM